MNRMKGLAAIFGAEVLMVIVAACGNGAEPTSLSDEVPTQALSTAGGTGHRDSNPPITPTKMEIRQALDVSEGSEVQSRMRLPPIPVKHLGSLSVSGISRLPRPAPMRITFVPVRLSW